MHYFLMINMLKRLLSYIAGDRIRLVISEAIAIEYLDIIMLHAASAGLTFAQVRKPLRKLIKVLFSGRFVIPKTKLNIVLTDPGDDKFFECTYEGNVKIIVTQDEDISSADQAYSKQTGKQVKIYSPWQLFQEYKDI